MKVRTAQKRNTYSHRKSGMIFDIFVIYSIDLNKYECHIMCYVNHNYYDLAFII